MFPTGTLVPSMGPLPQSCQNDIYNKPCAYDLRRACGGASPNNVQASSLLNDINSNCRYWKTQYENANIAVPDLMSDLIVYLDDTKKDFCTRFPLSRECKCLSFPTQQSEQCNSPTNTQCRFLGSVPCAGQYFSRVNQGFAINGTVTTGNFIEIDFAQCVPYPCWVDACLDPVSLLTSQIMDMQTSSACSSGVCINVQGTDYLRYDFTGQVTDFSPAFTIMAPCGGGQRPPTPHVVITTYSVAIDALSDIPFVITNNGTRMLNLVLDSTEFADWATVPSTITIAPQSAANISIAINQSLLFTLWQSANIDNTPVRTVATSPGTFLPKQQLAAPHWFFTFSDGSGPPQPFDFFLFLEIYAGSATRRYKEALVEIPKIPSWVYYAVLGCLGVFILSIVGVVRKLRSK